MEHIHTEIEAKTKPSRGLRDGVKSCVSFVPMQATNVLEKIQPPRAHMSLP